MNKSHKWLVVWYGPFEGMWYFMGEDGDWYSRIDMARRFNTKGQADRIRRANPNKAAARTARVERVKAVP